MAQSWLQSELYQARNTAPGHASFWHPAGLTVFSFVDQVLFRGKLPFTLIDSTPDHACLESAESSAKIHYPKPDNEISFDRLSSVYLSNTNHEEDQPCHLQLFDPQTPLDFNLPEYDEPAQRYCPAGVYEIIRAQW